MMIKNEKQALITNEVIDWVKNPKGERFRTLAGCAGTGKTVTIGFIVDELRKHGFSFAITATTNKAVKVLRNKFPHYAPNMSTIHSLLKVKPKRVGKEEIFESVGVQSADIRQYRVIIIDECSMINKHLLKIIKDETIDGFHKVLFVGDYAQLQPVNEVISYTFDYMKWELTEIVRYGDVIAEKSHKLRNVQHHVPISKLLAPPTIRKITVDELFEMYKGFRDEPDRVRLVTYTNERSKMWNKLIRNIDFGKQMDKQFVEGDLVLAREACLDDEDNIIMGNSEEGIVKEVRNHYEYFELRLDLGSGDDTYVRVIKEEFVDILNERLNKYAEDKDWSRYWKHKKFYHDIRHAYALTTHTSQGSTFQYTIIDSKDIDSNYNVEERNQLMYVAMTRSAQEVYFI
jgi:ATP-dependent exoDNAse (exonuclease V) alpha subunit